VGPILETQIKDNDSSKNKRIDDEKAFLFPVHGRAGVRFEPERHFL
jgi:hypothetical protein